MITLFPTPYPDELLYSQLARYYAKSGYMAYIFAAEDLYANSKTRPDIEFLNAFTYDAYNHITKHLSINDVVLKHTMFPYYGRFLPYDRRIKAFQSLTSMSKEYQNLLYIPKNSNRYLRYCPVCVNEDREMYGETYWHRAHQLPGVNICTNHKCMLIESSISLNSRVSPCLISAEEEIKATDVYYVNDDKEYNLSVYISKVFQSDVDMNSDIPLGKFLHSKLEGTKYLSPRGKARKMELLYKEFCEFYQGFQYNPLTQKWQLAKIFTNDRFNTYEVCMLAYFLDIPYDELVSMKLPQKTQTQLFDEMVLKLHKEGLNYREISNQLNASYDVVKSIGEGRYGKYHYPKQSKMHKSKKRDWDSFDSMMLPKVKELLNTLTNDKNKRPQKITVGMIERLLWLPKKTFNQCPKCTYEIQKHYETQEEYWIREINWAVAKLKKDNKPINLTNIMKLTNIRKSDVEKLHHL